MKKILLALLLFSINAKAQNQYSDYSKKVIESSKYWLDIDYVGDDFIGHKLDVHIPIKGKAPFPVVIYIYGSAFLSNNLKATAFSKGIGQKLLKNGFAVVCINHRSSDDAKFPAQIQDVKAAIRFIRANSSVFLLDSNFIGITGSSSGGHLAAMAGTTNNTKTDTIKGLAVDIEGSLGKFTNVSSSVNAVVDWYGPTDYLMDSCGSEVKHHDANAPGSRLIGGPIQENKDKAAVANPINYVNKSNPPFLIIHGNKDRRVPLCHSEKLYQKLLKEGVKSELVIVPEGGHGPGVMIEKYFDKMITFFKNQLEEVAK
jgi:acetyl esterase/lipase